MFNDGEITLQTVTFTGKCYACTAWNRPGLKKTPIQQCLKHGRTPHDKLLRLIILFFLVTHILFAQKKEYNKSI